MPAVNPDRLIYNCCLVVIWKLHFTLRLTMLLNLLQDKYRVNSARIVKFSSTDLKVKPGKNVRYGIIFAIISLYQ